MAPPRRIPSLPPLIAFESAARLASYSDAADELHITQSAISHRIRKLEDDIGAALFVRNGRAMALTAKGQKLLEFIVPILDDLEHYANRTQIFAKERPLRLGVGSALYSYWLGPRLARLGAVHDDVEIEIVTLWSVEQYKALALDLAILPMPANQQLQVPLETVLFRDDIFPVCRPNILDNLKATGLIELSRGETVNTAEIEAAERELEWHSWFSQVGQTYGLDCDVRYRFDSIALAMAAVLHGSGVGLGRTLLSADHLRNGVLVRPLPLEAKATSPLNLVLRRSADPGSWALLDRISEWLTAEVAATISALEVFEDDLLH